MPVPEMFRESLRRVRVVRAADHSYCGRSCGGVAFMQQERMKVRETVRRLRAARRSEGVLIERFGVK